MRSAAVPERQGSVAASVVEPTGGCLSMRVAVCSWSVRLQMVLSETRRTRTRETASRATTKSFACGLQVNETSWRISSSDRRCGL